MIGYRVELWCAGDCSTRYLQTILHDDPNTLTPVARKLIESARVDGWVEDRAAHFCPRCQRERHPVPDMTVADAKRAGGLR